MQLKAQRHARVQLFCPGLNDAERALTGLEMISDLGSAVAAAADRSVAAGGDGAVCVVPEGPYVIPVFQPTSMAA